MPQSSILIQLVATRLGSPERLGTSIDKYEATRHTQTNLPLQLYQKRCGVKHLFQLELLLTHTVQPADVLACDDRCADRCADRPESMGVVKEFMRARCGTWCTQCMWACAETSTLGCERKDGDSVYLGDPTERRNLAIFYVKTVSPIVHF